MVKRLDCKPTSVLEESPLIRFNGAHIGLKILTHSFSQLHHKDHLKEIECFGVDKSQLVTQLARGAYIVALGKPDLIFAFALASQNINPKTSDAKLLDTHDARAKRDCESVLRF